MTATVEALDVGLEHLEIRLDLDEIMAELEPGWQYWSGTQTKELSYAGR